MQEYLVIWRGSDEVIQSKVETDLSVIGNLSPKQWITLAAESEGFDGQEISEIIEHGFDLYAVIVGPVVFAY